MEVAIQTIRYTDTPYNGGSCFASGSPTVQVGLAGPSNPPVYVTCSSVNVAQALPPNTGVTREVNVYACGSAGCSATNYTVWAKVDFQDGSTCSAMSLATCGQIETIASWLVHNANS